MNERLRPLRVAEYVALARLGVFDAERVELIRGRVVSLAPPSEAHERSVEQVNELLVRTFGRWASVRPGCLIDAAEDSMPEVDFALVPSAPIPPPHPRSALLLIEVAEHSLRFDRLVKAPLYAEGGSPEYWIVNLVQAQLEVFREPKGGHWHEHFALTAAESICPVSFPAVTLALASLLGPLRG